MGKKAVLFLLIILAIAAFFRLWKLNSIPPGLYPDIAINGNDALDTLASGNFKLFYPENNGREGLFMWLIALSFSFLGASVWSIKIVAASFGILTVLGTYLLTKELFRPIDENQEKFNLIALFSSFFLAVSFWHVNFSRIGFRAIMLPFVLVFSFYFLFKGFRTKKLRNLIISGIFFGMGFYTYISFRLAVPLLFIVLLLWLLIYLKDKSLKQYLLLVSCLLATIFIVALPIGIYFLEHPQDFIGRAAGVSIFAAPNPVKKLAESLILHLAMFNFWGDQNWRHNFAGAPMLLWPVGILFLVGLFISIKDFILSLKNKNLNLLLVSFSLLSWFFFLLLPGVLTGEGIPHALRVIGVIPVVYIFVGLGAYFLYRQLKKVIKNTKLLIIITLLFLVAVGYLEFNKYFIKWANHPEVKDAFSANYVEIAGYLNSLSGEIQKYVIVNQSGVPVPWPNGIPMPSQTIMFLERAKYGQIRSTYLLPQDLNKIKLGETATVILPLSYEQGLLDSLKIIFPQGQIKEINEVWFYQI